MCEEIIKLTRFVIIRQIHIKTHKTLSLRITSNYGKISQKGGMIMKKQLLIIFMVTIVLATVFVAGCTGNTTNTTSTSPTTSTATTTPILSPSPSPKVTAMPTATPTKTPVLTPTPHVASCSFIGNRHTGVFHYAWCSDVLKMKPENKVCFDTAQQALAAGYRPCQHCHPHD